MLYLLDYGDWITTFCEEMWICEVHQCNFEMSRDPQPYNTGYPLSSRWPDGQHAQILNMIKKTKLKKQNP